MPKFSPEYVRSIRDMKTLHIGADADLKVDTGVVRVWLSRVTNEIETEVWDGNKWTTVAGEGR